MPAVKYTWSQIASLSSPRVYVSVTCCDGKIYVIGGCDELGQPVNTIEVYDPEGNTWQKLKNMPTKRAAPIVASIEGRIIVVGGVGVTQAPVDAVELYSCSENKWKRLQPLSEPLMGMAPVLKDNRINIFGGMGMDTNPRDHFKCLVLSSGGGEKWQAFTPMPTARYAAQAFHQNNKLYVLGGRQGKVPVAAFEVFDLNLRSWTVYPDIPSKRVFCSYVMTDKHVVSLGGLKQTAQQGFSDACELFTIDDNEKGEWLTNKRMSIPTKRGDFTAVAIDNQVLIVGGLGNDGKPISSTELFNPETKKWKRLTDTSLARCTSGTITHQGNIYLFGGISDDGPTATCEICKTESVVAV